MAKGAGGNSVRDMGEVLARDGLREEGIVSLLCRLGGGYGVPARCCSVE